MRHRIDIPEGCTTKIEIIKIEGLPDTLEISFEPMNKSDPQEKGFLRTITDCLRKDKQE